MTNLNIAKKVLINKVRDILERMNEETMKKIIIEMYPQIDTKKFKTTTKHEIQDALLFGIEELTVEDMSSLIKELEKDRLNER